MKVGQIYSCSELNLSFCLDKKPFGLRVTKVVTESCDVGTMIRATLQRIKDPSRRVWANYWQQDGVPSCLKLIEDVP